MFDYYGCICEIHTTLCAKIILKIKNCSNDFANTNYSKMRVIYE